MSDMDDSLAEWAVGERIRRLRKAALMTQDDLAAAGPEAPGGRSASPKASPVARECSNAAALAWMDG